MKKFIIIHDNKKYVTYANDYEEAIKNVKTIKKDDASALQVVNSLLEDERAAVDAYNVAIENLKGKIPEESMQAIIAIRDDENRHIENLQAVVNGNVTEKNLKDSLSESTIKNLHEVVDVLDMLTSKLDKLHKNPNPKSNGMITEEWVLYQLIINANKLINKVKDALNK